MHKYGKKLQAYLLATCLLGSGLGLAPSTANNALAKSKDKKSSKKVSQSAETQIKNTLNELAKAAASGNAQAMTDLFTETATYIDETGQATVGKSALLNRFTEGIKGNQKNSVSIDLTKVSMLGDSAAVARGVVKKAVEDEIALPSTRFMMVLKKDGDGWLISNATETPIENPAGRELLKNLAWLEGDWKATRNNATVKMSANWIGKKNFMLLRFEIERAGQPKVKEAQIIGWDPREGQPISWSFDSSGGFGSGYWFKKDNVWQVAVNGVHTDGSETNSINLFSMKDKDNFTWQSTSRTIGDELVPDSAIVNVERVK